MSKVHVNQIAKRLRDLFELIVPQDDLHQNDQQRNAKLLSRCLSAFAIHCQSGCTVTEAADSVVDGAEDNGLDAIFFNPTTKTLFIAQAKWLQSGDGEPSSADVAKFCKGVKDLIDSEWDRFNKRIVDKRDEIDAALADYELSVRMVLAHTGAATLAPHAQTHIDDLLLVINDTSEIVKFEQLNQSSLHQALSTGASGTPIDLEFGLANWGKVEEPLDSYYGTITGEELASWWKDYGDRLFVGNLRGVLGKTEVNQEVANTIENRASDFWFFNNGVTVVAGKVSKSLAGGSNRELGTFKAEAASIVNGAQTVSTIGRYAGSPTNLAKVVCNCA